MARSSLRTLLVSGAAVLALRAVGNAFIAGPRAAGVHSPSPVVGVAAGGLVAAAGAAPAFAAEEAKKAAELGFLNFGKIELGGGFAINLDIPETGIVNIIVLIGGLLYLLGPLLSNSMETREQEINQDIDDAIAKWDEANARLAEAKKNQEQADAVIAEIEASIAKDKADFKKNIDEATKSTLARQAKATDGLLASMQEEAGKKVNTFIETQAIERGVGELMNMKDKQQDDFMNRAIDSI
jgi:F-type H+-transporting ATPase subunit b